MRRADGTEHWVSEIYREITPPDRLVFTWAWEDDGVRGHEMLVALLFVARGGRTELVLTQTRFASEESRREHEQGWTSCLERFAETLPDLAAG